MCNKLKYYFTSLDRKQNLRSESGVTQPYEINM